MPRKKQTQRADKRFEYKLTLGRGVDGKLIRKSFYSRTSLADAKKQAEEYKIQQEVAARTGEAFTTGTKDFASWARKWLETYKKPFVDENTFISSYRNAVELHLIPFFGVAELSSIRPADIQHFFGTKTNLSMSYLKKLKMCLNGIFESAIENDICYKNPVRHITLRSEAEKHEKRVFTDRQIELVRREAVQVFPAVAILLDTGLRRGELLGLTWDDCKLDGCPEITVKRSVAVHNGRVVINPPKWKSFRTIPISADTATVLRGLPHTSAYVFPNRKNAPRDPNIFSRQLNEFMQQLHKIYPDIPMLTAHELRHTCGTAMRRRGVDIYTIQKVMGHRDIKMTSEIYVHNETERLRVAMNLDDISDDIML